MMLSPQTSSKLFVVSGPSGAGKGTLVAELLRRFPDLKLSVSATTRPKRPGETEGLDYHFIGEEEFEQKRSTGEFLETACVHEYWYGTLYEEVKRDLLAGHDVILEIDVQGALQVKSKIPNCVLVFIEPPSMRELEERLRRRRTESPKDISTRIGAAEKEMRAAPKYDYVVVNDEVERAADELAEIVQKERADTTTINI
jgi:guanylate kinase